MYKANYIGYELGNFLLPDYKGHEKCDVFFLLLQNPKPADDCETFTVKLGKTRGLNDEFFADCLKVLIYLERDGGQFSIHPVELKTKNDGTKYFDAESFLNQIGIEYKAVDTHNYRYFKARLYKYRKELIIKEDASEFSVIHRRINADDVESLIVHRNTKNVLKDAYFLTLYAKDRLVSYREVLYFATEEELLEYIREEFSATDGASIIGYTVDQLMKGASYEQGHRQGTETTTFDVRVIHNTNLSFLYNFLDTIEFEDDDEIDMPLSYYLREAKSVDDIENVVCLFNDSCENYW